MMNDDVGCPMCGCDQHGPPKSDSVTIPRAKYEALMALIEKIAAATLWSDHYGDSKSDRIVNPPSLTPEDVRSARALRAAGIQREE